MIKGKKKKFKIDPESTRISILNDDGNIERRYRGPRKIDTIQYQEKVERVYELLKSGMASNEIYATLLFEDNDLKEEYFAKLLTHAYEFAENSLHKDREFVFQLHMDRYEKMYQQSILMTDNWGRQLDHKTNGADWPVMVARYLMAMKCLKSKEDLIGLHDKSIVLEFNDNKAIVVKNEDLSIGKYNVPGYDLDSLSLEDKIELLALIKESRTIPIEGIQRVIVKTTKIEINTQTGERVAGDSIVKIDKVETHDVPYEEMPPDVVSKFEDIEVKDEEDNTEYSPLLLGEAAQTRSKTAEDIKKDIQGTLLEAFRNKMKERNK